MIARCNGPILWGKQLRSFSKVQQGNSFKVYHRFELTAQCSKLQYQRDVQYQKTRLLSRSAELNVVKVLVPKVLQELRHGL